MTKSDDGEALRRLQGFRRSLATAELSEEEIKVLGASRIDAKADLVAVIVVDRSCTST